MAKLHFYYAAMNAGKSTTLLQADYNYRERGMDTLLFAPAIDTRYQKNQITSRIGIKAPATAFDSEFDFLAFTKETLKSQSYQCILIDEAHFLNKKQVEQLCMIADYLNIPVIAYGLRSDFLGEPFEGSQYLLLMAEELIEIKAMCHCGAKATMNMRIDQEGNKITHGDQIEIGGNDRYVSTCRRHYTEGDSGMKQTNG